MATNAKKAQFSRAIDTELAPNALTVLQRRYLKKDEDGNPTEQPSDMFRRVAENIASAEKSYGKSADEVKETALDFYDLMTSLEFLPNSPTLMNAGRDLQQLSACFVLPIGDSMEEIFTAVKDTALIHKSARDFRSHVFVAQARQFAQPRAYQADLYHLCVSLTRQPRQ